jgi:hypothetical protein
METKDIASIVISAIALIVSSAAFFVSYVRGKRERQQNLRLQLDDTQTNHVACC